MMRTLHLWFEWLEPGMQKRSKVFGWSVIRSLHFIKWCDVRKLAFLHNTMIQNWFMVNKFLTMSYSILFEFQVFNFICNTYYIVLFILGFEAALERCLWLMLWMQHWPIMGYLRDNMPMMQRLYQCGTRGPMGSHPPPIMTQIAHSLSQFWLGCYFGLQDLM